ncbi:MAG: MFS transporter [Ectothiorhodospiraceae bacterium]|nr:MFS transporter [Ectothiorhodospiraceae bacterium]
MSAYLRLLYDRRLLFIFILGFASGFPWALIGNTFSAWLHESGLTRTAIGVLGSLAMIYALNFLWAPFLDRVKLPFLHGRLGQRRSWILLTQGGILLGTLAISTTNPALGTLPTALAALLIVSSSATQDVAVDAYRIELVPAMEPQKMAAASAMTTAGWWTGAGLPSATAFMLAGPLGWSGAYLFMGLILACLMLVVMRLPEPKTDREEQQARAEREMRETLTGKTNPGLPGRAAAWLAVTAVEPFAEFFRRNGWQLALAILGFIVLFKIGEAFMGRMAAVFYLEVGFTREQIAWVSGYMGWATMLLFTLLGGLVNVTLGIFRGLLIGGITMALANLLFALLAVVGPDMPLFALAVVVDNFTTAFSTVTFVAFISYLTSRVYTASQYALMASLGNLSRTTLAAGSGALVDWLGGDWATFFVITTVMVTPGLILLLLIRSALTRRMGAAFSRRRAATTTAGPAD